MREFSIESSSTVMIMIIALYRAPHALLKSSNAAFVQLIPDDWFTSFDLFNSLKITRKKDLIKADFDFTLALHQN
jgi:hypothetical protein